MRSGSYRDAEAHGPRGLAEGDAARDRSAERADSRKIDPEPSLSKQGAPSDVVRALLDLAVHQSERERSPPPARAELQDVTADVRAEHVRADARVPRVRDGQRVRAQPLHPRPAVPRRAHGEHRALDADEGGAQ